MRPWQLHEKEQKLDVTKPRASEAAELELRIPSSWQSPEWASEDNVNILKVKLDFHWQNLSNKWNIWSRTKKKKFIFQAVKWSCWKIPSVSQPKDPNRVTAAGGTGTGSQNGKAFTRDVFSQRGSLGRGLLSMPETHAACRSLCLACSGGQALRDKGVRH